MNLFLAVTGKRADGFHDLISLVAPLQFGDTLTLEQRPPGGPATMECADPAVPTDHSNLILKASQLFAKKQAPHFSPHFRLEKHIPMGAGLGGGSSNAVAALRLLNQACGEPLDLPTLHALAAELGSDCPLFLYEGPVLIRGRGEIVEPLPANIREILSGWPMALFQPEFSVPTAWAYGQLAAQPELYDPAAPVIEQWQQWLQAPRRETLPIRNTFEKVAFRKYLVYETLNDLLEKQGFPRQTLSGSGSACFLGLQKPDSAGAIEALIKATLGPHTFVKQTALS